MPSIATTRKHAVLTANGTTGGLATIVSNTGFFPKATCWLRSSGSNAVLCVVVEQIGSTQVRLRFVSNPVQMPGAFSDISAYLTGATLDLEGGQVVPVDPAFSARPLA